jgi:hypothetical protein
VALPGGPGVRGSAEGSLGDLHQRVGVVYPNPQAAVLIPFARQEAIAMASISGVAILVIARTLE